MAVMVLDPELADEILEGRNGFYRPNRREEVWDEVTYIMPEANVEHDDIAGFFYRSFWDPAKLCGTHYCGGPDIALEVLSPDDRSRDKLEFYAMIGTREVIILDRDPWQLELYQLDQEEMKLSGVINPGDGKKLACGIGPIEYELVRGEIRPKVKIVHTETGQEWLG